MNRAIFILLILTSTNLTGCIIFPLRVIEPLETNVLDARTKKPIEGAKVLRIVCDVHDFGCKHATIDRSVTSEKGLVLIEGKRQWGIWIPAPGGFPVPNHQIVIWKEGYYAFVFSQYDRNIENFRSSVKNQNILDAISEIPNDRKYLSKEIDPALVLNGGKVEFYKLRETELSK